jgi:archaellum component FlaF (FlaF/FlaG flagellin family)
LCHPVESEVAFSFPHPHHEVNNVGFSVTLASAIVLIGFIAIFTSFTTALSQGVNELSTIAHEYVNRERDKIDVQLQLTVNNVTASSCTVTVKNTGSKTIFLRSQNGYKWNTLMVAYGTGSQWQSYPIEEYEILAVRISGTNATFNPAVHSYVNSGEEASLAFTIPAEAPEIPSGAVVAVTFASHYGVTAQGEGVFE